MLTLDNLLKKASNTSKSEIQEYFKIESELTDSECIRLALNKVLVDELSKALKKYVVVSDINLSFAKHDDIIASAKHISVLTSADSVKRLIQIDFAKSNQFNIVTSLRVVDKLTDSSVACYLTDNKYKHKLKNVSYENLIDVLNTCLSILSVDK